MKHCSNSHCYGAKASQPCYTYKELQAIMKIQGKQPKATKKEMCKSLDIPYYTYMSLHKYQVNGGKYEYPNFILYDKYPLRGFKYMKEERKVENRLFGMLLFELINMNLSVTLKQSEQDEYHTSSLDKNEFLKRIPEIPDDFDINFIPKNIAEHLYKHALYVVEKFKKIYFLDEITRNYIAEKYIPFCFIMRESRPPIIIKNSINNQHKGLNFIPILGQTLKHLYPDIWDLFKYKYFIAQEALSGSFVGGGFYSDRHDVGTIIQGIPYTVIDEMTFYIVPDSFQDNTLINCTGHKSIANLFGIIKKGNVCMENIPIYISGYIVSTTSRNQTPINCRNNMEVPSDININRAIAETLDIIKIQAGEKIKKSADVDILNFLKINQQEFYRNIYLSCNTKLNDVKKYLDKIHYDGHQNINYADYKSYIYYTTCKKHNIEQKYEVLMQYINIKERRNNYIMQQEFINPLRHFSKSTKNPTHSPTKNTLQAISISEKAFVITGNTIPYIKMLKDFRGKFGKNWTSKGVVGWMFAKINYPKLQAYFNSQKIELPKNW